MIIDNFEVQKQTLKQHNQRINGTILNAINSYESRGVPLKQLLSDYNDVISYQYELKKAVNPWQYLNSNIKQVPIVCGVSTAEALFCTSAMSLQKQRPIEVLKSIYYRNKSRNDSALERVFVSSFQKSITADEKVLIMNPSPFAVELFESYRNNNIYATIDQTTASLYSKQFKYSEFVPIESIHIVTNVSLIIIFANNVDKKILEKILAYMGTVRARRIYGIIPTRIVNNKMSSFWKAMSASQYTIRNIIIVPKEVSSSTPKNKSFVCIENETENSSITIRKMEYNSFEKSVDLAERKIIVSQEELLTCNTVNALCKETISDKVKKTNYNSAELYAFSREIQISYILYKRDQGYYAKAYYTETKNTQLTAIRGKALTNRIERGLHEKTTDKVIDALEKIPYLQSMAGVITEDITTYYLNVGKPITLKTLWFCLRDGLQKNCSYDDEFMKELFSRGNVISDIYPEIDKGNDFKQAIKAQFAEGEEIQELKALKMLNLVISEAINKGYLFENRILPLIPVAQNRATKRQAEVRQALTKRSFETVEEKKIMKYLIPLCIKSSIFLAVVIRLMTGISIREVCGLLWSDFHYDETLDIFRLSITKFVDSNAKIIHHVMNDSWEKYRVLPISFLLGEMIMARKEFLNKEGLNDKVLEEYPIVLPREDLSRMQKGYRPIYCKPSSVSEKCREAVRVAEIPQLHIVLPDRDGKEIEADLNNYNGDIFRTNFRDKALNVAGFGLDELNYYLGIKRPDTFSQHYCDYTNQYVQLQMARKLDRWTESYESGTETEYNGKSATGTISGIGDGVQCVEIEFYKSNVENDSIAIQIESMYGFNVAISSINGDSTYEETSYI